MKLVLTCEHAFPHIPQEYKSLFAAHPEVLKTHEAFDPGAYDLFQLLQPLADFSHFQETGRLLVETNRSKWHQKLFSRFSKDLPVIEKKRIIDIYYDPYRNLVQKNLQKLIDSGNVVLHISIHTFTPVLKGMKRNCDVGILYDPARAQEKKTGKYWKAEIMKESAGLRIRYNYPYLGKADGFTTSLRKIFGERYTGIELEVNQKWVSANKMDQKLKTVIFRSLQKLKEKKPLE